MRIVPTTLLVSVMLGLVGVAFGQEAPDTWPVETPYGSIPVGHVTLPVAPVHPARPAPRAPLPRGSARRRAARDRT
jgi:hypothetical protein